MKEKNKITKTEAKKKKQRKKRENWKKKNEEVIKKEGNVTNWERERGRKWNAGGRVKVGRGWGKEKMPLP
jgi:hypothetical protein